MNGERDVPPALAKADDSGRGQGADGQAPAPVLAEEAAEEPTEPAERGEESAQPADHGERGEESAQPADHGERGEESASSDGLPGILEALLFLSPDPLSAEELAEAVEVDQDRVRAALALLGEALGAGGRGLCLREVGGGFTLASNPAAEPAARRLLARPRVATLTPAQTETLAIVAYLQPVSRPEIGRIRGVSADSATATLLERGLIEEAGRSEFGAALYRTTTLFLKLFGLKAIEDLPDVEQWDPSPEEKEDLRQRLLHAGEARAGGGPGGEG